MSVVTSAFALTAQGEFVGTIDYTAPELVLGKGADARLDVYSLGCLFYECLAGQLPFPKERDVEVLYAHIQDPPPRVSAVRPDLSPALDDVIVKAMAKDPGGRYLSAGDLGRAALAAAQGQPLTPADRNVAEGEAAPATRPTARAAPPDRTVLEPERPTPGTAVPAAATALGGAAQAGIPRGSVPPTSLSGATTISAPVGGSSARLASWVRP